MYLCIFFVDGITIEPHTYNLIDGINLIVWHREVASPLFIEYFLDAAAYSINHIEMHHCFTEAFISEMTLWSTNSQSLLQSARNETATIGEGLKWLARLGHELEPPVPSLFSLRMDHEKLCDLMGTVVDDVTVHLPGTKFRADGPLLITHWGMSGPAILELPGYAARYLAEQAYNVQLSVNWLQSDESHVQSVLMEMTARQPQKQLTTYSPFGLSLRLWNHLVTEALGFRSQIRWSEMNRKDMNRLTNTLVNITYPVAGRAPFKDEFVICGGVSLKSINPSTPREPSCPSSLF